MANGRRCECTQFNRLDAHFEGTRCARVPGEMKWRRVSATASVALGTLLVSWLICACNSPTLPVPPPADPLNVPSALLVDSEHVSLSGTQAWPGALVIAMNQTLLESNPEE